MNYKKEIERKEYSFLKANNHLEKNICLLGLGGSHAYGTNIEGSDLDIRGFAINSAEEILLGEDFEQVVNEKTDTVIYSLKKGFRLLTNCNPNCIEILGLKPDHYLKISKEGQMLLDNKGAFLSRKAINSFGGYAKQLLSRLISGISSDEDLGMRNRKAKEHGKLAKHSMHLVRLYYMCFDILEKGEINTHREKEHDLLMEIRNGKFLTKEDKLTAEFPEFLNDLEKRFAYDKENTFLPENPDYEKINDILTDIHLNQIKKKYNLKEVSKGRESYDREQTCAVYCR